MFSLPSFNPWSLLPYAVAVPAIFVAGAMWDADGREDRAFRKGNETSFLVSLACMTDKATAWEEVRNARTEKHNQAAQFDRILVAGELERATYRVDLAKSMAESKRSRDEAIDIMKRLDDVRSELAKAWAENRIPADYTCGVLKSPGCPGVPGSAASAGDDRDKPVPPGQAGRDAGAPGAGTGTPVPGLPADRPRNP